MENNKNINNIVEIPFEEYTLNNENTECRIYRTSICISIENSEFVLLPFDKNNSTFFKYEKFINNEWQNIGRMIYFVELKGLFPAFYNNIIKKRIWGLWVVRGEEYYREYALSTLDKNGHPDSFYAFQNEKFQEGKFVEIDPSTFPKYEENEIKNFSDQAYKLFETEKLEAYDEFEEKNKVNKNVLDKKKSNFDEEIDEIVKKTDCILYLAQLFNYAGTYAQENNILLEGNYIYNLTDVLLEKTSDIYSCANKIKSKKVF